MSARILPKKIMHSNHVNTRTRTYGKVEVDPFAPWDMSVTPPDRDELIHHQDIIVDKFYKRGWKDKQLPPNPQSPTERSHSSGSKARVRPPTHTSGTVYYPSEYSNEHGIHEVKWKVNGGLNQDSVSSEWARPVAKGKTSGQHLAQILSSIKPKKERESQIYLERSIASLLLNPSSPELLEDEDEVKGE